MKKFFIILLLVAIFLPSFTLSQITTAQQIGLCGAENISAGTKGEVRLRIQTGGTDLNTETCWPKSCSTGMAASTVVSDKYISGSAEMFAFQKICMADADSLSLSECSSVISSEGQKCSPTKCNVGFLDVGLLTELRDKSGNFWTENVYRLCAKGSKIINATLVFKENYGNFSAAEQCPANFSDAGIFRQVHFNTSEYYRAWRICTKFAMDSTTTTPTIINATNVTITSLTPTTPSIATTTLKATTTTSPPTTTYPTTAPYSPTTSFPVPAPTIGKSPCSESDGGISIYSAGSVRVENGTLYLDACAENNLINEYYCSNGTASIYTGNCTAGCLNSACRGAGEALLERGALVATKIVDSIGYVIDLVASGKILERGVALVGKIIDTASSFLDFFSKLIGKGSQYVDTIEIANKTGNMTNITTSTT